MLSFEPTYRREPGIHQFVASDESVTAVAMPDWDSYLDGLQALPPTTGYIVSPELITTARPLAEIAGLQPRTNQRVEQVCRLSKDQPVATVLLGTATTDHTGALRNSLAVIQNGTLTGYIDKRGAMWPDEEQLFSQARRPQSSLRHQRHGALICSDMITASFDNPQLEREDDFLTPQTQLAIVSSCWAIPRAAGKYTPVSHEERFRGALERTIDRLFASHPQLVDIVMVDRAIAGSQVAPYTAQFSRK